MEAAGSAETLANFLPDYSASHPRKHSSEDGRRGFFRNIDNFTPDYTTSYHRKQFSSLDGGVTPEEIILQIFKYKILVHPHSNSRLSQHDLGMGWRPKNRDSIPDRTDPPSFLCNR
jgi:hypothetical protein